MRICSDVKTENRKPFQCHPSYKTIGNAVGMSKNTVKKYVDSLIEKQLITAEPTSVITQKGEKRNGNLRYTIRPIAEALEQYYEQQLIRLHERNAAAGNTEKTCRLRPQTWKIGGITAVLRSVRK